MIRSVSGVTAILLFALVNITALPTTVKAQKSHNIDLSSIVGEWSEKGKSKLLISASANTKFKTFVEKRTYSIAYPQNWFVKRVWKYSAHITNRRMPEIGHDGIPDYFIKTDVEIVEKNSRELSSSIEGSKIIKKANVRIDGKNAVRLWLTDSEGETLLTFLPYRPNKTVYMITFYTKNNSHLLPLIERIHSSFKSLN
jgi:hypothetical protein